MCKLLGHRGHLCIRCSKMAVRDVQRTLEHHDKGGCVHYAGKANARRSVKALRYLMYLQPTSGPCSKAAQSHFTRMHFACWKRAFLLLSVPEPWNFLRMQIPSSCLQSLQGFLRFLILGSYCYKRYIRTGDTSNIF